MVAKKIFDAAADGPRRQDGPRVGADSLALGRAGAVGEWPFRRLVQRRVRTEAAHVPETVQLALSNGWLVERDGLLSITEVGPTLTGGVCPKSGCHSDRTCNCIVTSDTIYGSVHCRKNIHKLCH